MRAGGRASGWPVLGLCLAGVVWIQACGSADVDDPIGDASVTARVITALSNDPIVGRFRFQVTTFRGVVTLGGRVDTTDAAAHAAALARTVPGVLDVRSRLIVVPPTAAARRGTSLPARP